MLVSFGLLGLVWFPSDPCFIHQNAWFLLWYIYSVLHRWFSPFMDIDRTRVVRKLGEGREGSCGWIKIVRGCAQKIILVRDLLHQAKYRYWVLVRLLVTQGTGYSRSADNSWLWPRKRNFDTTINAATHVQNWFIHFLWHELTQIHEYNQGLISYHSININNKWKKNVSVDCGSAYHVFPS